MSSQLACQLQWNHKLNYLMVPFGSVGGVGGGGVVEYLINDEDFIFHLLYIT